MPRRSKAPEKKGTSFTTWKFQLENTINADPMADGECLQIVRAYLDFMGSADARPYLSILQLRVATSLAEHTIINRRRKLVSLGYFTAEGKTSSGSTRYKIVNARANLVLDHQTIMRETLKRLEAEKKERDREKRKMSPAPHAGLKGERPCTVRRDSPAPHAGNYVYNSVDAISMEGRDYLKGEYSADIHPAYSSENLISDQPEKIGPANLYVLARDGDELDAPYPVPADEAEAESAVAALCAGSDMATFMHRRLTSMLTSGVLTPRMASNIIKGRAAA